MVTNEQELMIRRQADEVVQRVLKGAVPFGFASPRLQAIIVEVESPEQIGKKKRDLAEEERQWWESWYHTLGFTGVKASKPLTSNREFARFKKRRSGLIYVPATTRKFYEQFMTQVGQGNHWTVADVVREGIVWDNAQPVDGYWLKVETSLDCPWLKTSWNTLNKKVKRLLVLVEYAILWHSYKARTG